MNYQDVLQQLKIPFVQAGHKHVRPGWVGIDCPYCGPHSNSYHLGLNLSRGYLNCWVCGGLPLVKTLAEIARVSPAEIIPLVRTALPTREVSIRPRGRLRVPPSVEELGSAHRNYLANRGFDPGEIASIWGVKGISIASRLSWRLFIPIDYRYETVSWTTRTIGEGPSRYISASPEEETIPHRELLYGSDLAGMSVIVVEGPTDAWAIGPGAVATMGLAYTPQQVNLIRAYPRRGICFDNSPEAQRRAKKLCDTLSVFPGETYLINMSGKDPATSPKTEIQELRKRLL